MFNYKHLVLLIFSVVLRTSANERVVCYFSSWAVHRQSNGNFTIEDIDVNLCSNIIYAFIGLNTNGTLNILDPHIDLELRGFERFNELKQWNPNLKTSIALGGGGEESIVYSNMIADPSLRRNLINSAVDFMKTYGFDGFDLDWEFPAKYGGAPEDRDNFSILLEELRTEFDKHGYLLSAAVSPTPLSVDISYQVPALSKYLDFINVMTYNFHGQWDNRTGQNSPLYPSPIDISDYQKTLNINTSIQGWLDRGADPRKLVVGVTTYARTFTLSSDDTENGAPISGPGNPGPYTKSSGILAYYEICEMLLSDGWVKIWDDQQKVPYAFKDDQWISYDNPESMLLKIDFIKSKNLGGAMIWSIDMDDFRGTCGDSYPLLKTINNL